jgi:hypothetical protein
MTALSTRLNPRLGKVAARICTEFHEMPGMGLTEAQVRRLWSLSAQECHEALGYLCDSCRVAHDPSGCDFRETPRVHAPLPLLDPIA